MLVLSRKQSQEIVLSNGTTFKVLGIERGRVQVGIAAPAGVRILRAECLPNAEHSRADIDPHTV
jgi:carbon storage regulator CsrA